MERYFHGCLVWISGIFVMMCDPNICFRVVGAFLILLGFSIGLGLNDRYK